MAHLLNVKNNTKVGLRSVKKSLLCGPARPYDSREVKISDGSVESKWEGTAESSLLSELNSRIIIARAAADAM